MKVTTDGCLFGALVANDLSTTGSCRMLDIGAGTGLLSLMMAQANEVASIDGVEIEKAASDQATENVAASPWGKRIVIHRADVRQYEPAFQYDCIVSNPPFYEQQLSSPNVGRQLAHHDSGLTLQLLFLRVQKLIKEEGKFFVLLPFYRAEEAIAIAETTGFFVEKQWQVRQSPKHSFFRSIFLFSKNRTAIASQFEILIRDEAGSYSETFVELLRPFYLNL